MKRAYFIDNTVIECARECELRRCVRNYFKYDRLHGYYGNKVYYNPNNPQYKAEAEKFYNEYIAPLE